MNQEMIRKKQIELVDLISQYKELASNNYQQQALTAEDKDTRAYATEKLKEMQVLATKIGNYIKDENQDSYIQLFNENNDAQVYKLGNVMFDKDGIELMYSIVPEENYEGIVRDVLYNGKEMKEMLQKETYSTEINFPVNLYFGKNDFSKQYLERIANQGFTFPSQTYSSIDELIAKYK